MRSPRSHGWLAFLELVLVVLVCLALAAAVAIYVVGRLS